MADRTANDGLMIDLTADIVSAYVSHNALSLSDVGKLVRDVFMALGNVSAPVEAPPMAAPAVSVRKSVTPDYLICLDDGMKFKSLKRHLRKLGMTPQQYRDKWHLPADYPMVAANYSATRSGMAKSLGLGRKAAPAVAEPTPSKSRRKMAEITES